MKWFRLYHDLPNDRKLKRFTTEQKWAWVVLLCVASESSQRGLIHDEDEEDLSDHCGFESKQDFQYFLDKLRQKGMIEHTERGIKIVHWEERQYSKPSDLPEATKQRKRKQREKERVIQNQNVTRDIDVTLTGHGVMSRHTDPDSETDPDKKIKEIPQTPFEDFPRFDGESGSGGREVISFSEKAEERYSPSIQIEPPRRASERLEYPDTMVDPLMRQTMPSRANFERAENPEFSSMRFEEFWQYSVPTGARRNKGEAKRQFMGISGIDYKTFKTCYEKAVKSYQDKNPNEKPDERFRFFKGLGRWIEDEEWIDFVPEHSRGGSMNLELVIKGLPRSFRKETYVILADGDWRVNMALCNAAEHANFSRGSYRPESYRRIYDMKDFLEKNPDCIQLAEIDG
jgi:hypothetical protein